MVCESAFLGLTRGREAGKELKRKGVQGGDGSVTFVLDGKDSVVSMGVSFVGLAFSFLRGVLVVFEWRRSEYGVKVGL